MARRKLHYKEGDWFAVPLEGGGYALGLIARMKPKSIGLLGYFFGPRYPEVPTLADATPLRPADAIQRLIFGDRSLLDQKWPVLGSLPGWDRQHWPLPRFADRDVINNHARIRTYDEDSLACISERWAQEEDIIGLPDDGLFPAGAVILRISRCVREQEQEAQSAES